MKAEIRKDGHLWIIAETPTEAFAIKHLFPLNDKRCKECGKIESLSRLILDESVLMDEKDGE